MIHVSPFVTVDWNPNIEAVISCSKGERHQLRQMQRLKAPTGIE